MSLEWDLANAINILLGGALGAIVSWLISHWYAKRSDKTVNEARDETLQEIKAGMTGIAGVLQSLGLAEIQMRDGRLVKVEAVKGVLTEFRSGALVLETARKPQDGST